MSVSPRRAFSLIELLCVIALLGLMMTVSAPLLSSFRGSGDVNAAVFNVSLLMEQARAFALANNAYVWVGFRQEDDHLMVSTVTGVTGAPADIRTPASIRALNRIKKFPNIELAATKDFEGMAASFVELQANSPFLFRQSVAGSQITFDRVIEFNPEGGARLVSDVIPRWIQVGLKPKSSTSNDAAIQVAGLTGQVRVFRR